jgi:hypothetical protein
MSRIRPEAKKALKVLDDNLKKINKKIDSMRRKFSGKGVEDFWILEDGEKMEWPLRSK